MSNVTKQAEIGVRPLETKRQKTGRILRNAAPALFGNWVNWERRENEAGDARQERAEWVANRAGVLASYYAAKGTPRTVEAFERASLELFCALREEVPKQGLPINALRLCGFKLDVDGEFKRHYDWEQRQLSPMVLAVFPDDWSMEPAGPAEDPMSSSQAEIIDPHGDSRFSVFYRAGLYGLIKASFSPIE